MRVIVSPLVRRKMDAQIAYIAERNPAAARKMRDRLRAALKRLGQKPQPGRPGVAVGTRELVVQRTAYVFVFENIENEVHVLRLYHGNEDWQREMEEWARAREAGDDDDTPEV